MRGLRDLQRAAILALLGLAAGSGCTHYHYYGAPSPGLCEQPAIVAQRPVMAPYGSVCEVPESSTNSAPSLMAATPRRGEVIVSRPQGVSGARRNGSRFAWHRPDPESLATTRVEGGLDESAVR